MTVQQLALRMLALSGINSLTTDGSGGALLQRGIVPGDTDNVAAAITAAFQAIFSDGPSSLSEQPGGAILQPPMSVNVTVTQGSVEITFPVMSGTFGLTYNDEGEATGFAYNITGSALATSLGEQTDQSFTGTGPAGGPWTLKVQPGGQSEQAPPMVGDASLLLPAGSEIEIVSQSDNAPSSTYTYQISIINPMATAYAGCTIRIPGDGYDNQLQYDTGQLVRPYMGTSGTFTATVFGDAVVPTSPSGLPVKSVLEPIMIANHHELHLCADRASFEQWPRQTYGGYPTGMWATRNRGCGDFIGYGYIPKRIGYPAAAFVDTQFGNTGTQGPPIFVRVNPMPWNSYPIEYRLKLHSPIYTAADVGTQGSDPGTVVPMLVHESILLAYCKHYWTEQSNVVITETQAAAVDANYKRAMNDLQGLKPKQSSSPAYYE